MYRIETKRLVGLSDMTVENGCIAIQTQSYDAIDILELKPSTGRESGFLFYEKNNMNVLVCHIGITWKRGRIEVSYGTESDFRKQGYMQEALRGLLNWIIEETNEDKIWAIPNGEESKHILEKCGFVFFGKVETDLMRNWFLFSVDR